MQHGLVTVNDDTIVMAGGVNEDANGHQFPTTDVWRSTNGADWDHIIPNPTYTGRTWASLVSVPVQGGHWLWLIGGQWAGSLFNDISVSGDSGNSWHSIGNAPWLPRFGMSVVVANSRVIMTGGTQFWTTYFNDVWICSGLDDWQQVPAAPSNAPFLPRFDASMVVFNTDSLLLVGGVGLGPYSDAWVSTDMGWSWMKVTDDVGFASSNRHGAGAIVVGSQLVMVGGVSNNNVIRDDVWTGAL
jgi:hypothetical protein